jgi:hypothetical protein
MTRWTPDFVNTRISSTREIAVALADLLRQVNEFCEEQGEAEFYTGNAMAALGLSDNPVHLQTLADLRSQSDAVEPAAVTAEREA